MPGSKEADFGVPQACAALLSDLKYVRVAKAEHGDRLSARPRADRPPSMRAGDQCCPVTVIRLGERAYVLVFGCRLGGVGNHVDLRGSGELRGFEPLASAV